MSVGLVDSGVKMFVTLWLRVFWLWAVDQLLSAVVAKSLGRLQEHCIGFTDVVGQYSVSTGICRSVCICYSLLVVFWSVCIVLSWCGSSVEMKRSVSRCSQVW